MENPTAFDLKAALERWGEELSHSPNFRSGDLQELESHLRDSIAVWQGKGLSDEEAFLIATRRLGAAPTLASEFAKVNGREVWLDRVLWMVVGIQLFWLCSSFSTAMANASVAAGLAGFGNQFQSALGQMWGIAVLPGILFALARLLGLALAIGGCWYFIRRKREKLSQFAVQLLRRPFAAGLAAIAGGSMLVKLSFPLHLLLIRKFSREQYGAMLLSANFGELLIPLVTTIALAAVTLSLARRRLRLRASD